MPDPILMAKATGVAFAVAAVILAIATWCGYRRESRPTWIDAGWVFGLGAGFYLGCWLLGVQPHWPPSEDVDRLLCIVVPAVLAVELLSAFPRVPRWLAWALRVAIAGGLARALLHGSIYLTDPGTPDSQAWPKGWAWPILGSLAAFQILVWALLVRLARRSPGVAPMIGLAIVSGGSAITIMLSAYASGGQIGLPLSAAILGASAVAMVGPKPVRLTAPIGVAIVGISSLLVIGRFFGELRTDHAVLLFMAPLLAWIPELPRLRRMPPWARGLLGVFLVGAVVSGVLADAARRFIGGTESTAPGSKEPSVQDYMDYGR